jgi:AraC-like DNA-binding protein
MNGAGTLAYIRQINYNIQLMDVYKRYRPVTATPFRHNETYTEYTPCDALKPYIRCFWGSNTPYRQIKTDHLLKTLVVPDTCMDIIFDINYTDNRIQSSFCGINDRSFITDDRYDKEKLISTFAIRFYAWSASLFSKETMDGVLNASIDPRIHFPKLTDAIEPLLFNITGIKGRITAAEKYLLQYLMTQRTSPLVMEATAEILKRKGNIKTGDLAAQMLISSRQLERIFRGNMGISPKKLSSLIRYQFLWNDILFRKNFNSMDEAQELGYTDQAHLLHDFHQFHTMNITAARKLAGVDVAFLQEKKADWVYHPVQE